VIVNLLIQILTTGIGSFLLAVLPGPSFLPIPAWFYDAISGFAGTAGFFLSQLGDKLYPAVVSMLTFFAAYAIFKIPIVILFRILLKAIGLIKRPQPAPPAS